MKTSFRLLSLLGALLVVISSPMTRADATVPTTGPTNASAATTPDGEQGQRRERLKEALAQLNLTDAQKDQIKQIRASVTDRKERRQQIMAVLTPDQKAKLVAMWQAHKEAGGTGADGTNSEQ